MVLLIFYLALALGVSFLCSVLEAVILSVPLSFVHSREEKGLKSAALLRKQKEAIDRPLSAILTLNTIAHTIGAAGVGAQAVALFGKAWFGVISAVLTLLILFLSEIIPKTLGATWWRELALPASRILQIMILLTWPLVKISEALMALVSREKGHPPISRSELEALALFGVRHGVLEEKESRIISNLVGLREVRVSDVMTPRTVMVAAPADLSLQAYLQDRRLTRYSRLPLYEGSLDKVTGYLLRSDAFHSLRENRERDIPLSDLARPVTVCPEQLPLPQVIDLLLENREKMALVVDEYGGTEGVVTMEDAIETLLGEEIIDETDLHADLQAVARRQWEKRRQRLNDEFEAAADPELPEANGKEVSKPR